MSSRKVLYNSFSPPFWMICKYISLFLHFYVSHLLKWWVPAVGRHSVAWAPVRCGRCTFIALGIHLCQITTKRKRNWKILKSGIFFYIIISHFCKQKKSSKSVHSRRRLDEGIAWGSRAAAFFRIYVMSGSSAEKWPPLVATRCNNRIKSTAGHPQAVNASWLNVYMKKITACPVDPPWYSRRREKDRY